MSLASDRHLVLEEFSTELLAAPKWREMENVRRATQCTCRNVYSSNYDSAGLNTRPIMAADTIVRLHMLTSASVG